MLKIHLFIQVAVLQIITNDYDRQIIVTIKIHSTQSLDHTQIMPPLRDTVPVFQWVLRKFHKIYTSVRDIQEQVSQDLPYPRTAVHTPNHLLWTTSHTQPLQDLWSSHTSTISLQPLYQDFYPMADVSPFFPPTKIHSTIPIPGKQAPGTMKPMDPLPMDGPTIASPPSHMDLPIHDESHSKGSQTDPSHLIPEVSRQILLIDIATATAYGVPLSSQPVPPSPDHS